jgi:hypothetical protein
MGCHVRRRCFHIYDCTFIWWLRLTSERYWIFFKQRKNQLFLIGGLIKIAIEWIIFKHISLMIGKGFYVQFDLEDLLNWCQSFNGKHMKEQISAVWFFKKHEVQILCFLFLFVPKKCTCTLCFSCLFMMLRNGDGTDTRWVGHWLLIKVVDNKFYALFKSEQHKYVLKNANKLMQYTFPHLCS